ncbi:hypothetical protein BC829DRAFT_201566 [Chytridium lagenaria]|nr:hypothetical protein BC829DRAFT_201566 [Chytridium lagenaria]
MTVYDFMRSILPYRLYSDGTETRRVPSAEKFFSLADTDGDGLISFSEYIVFLTLLATPMENWRVSFLIFDDDGNGTVSKAEFEKLMSLHLETVRAGAKMGSFEKGNSLNLPRSSGLLRVFFGEHGDRSLTYDAFADFLSRLQLEMLKLEFHQFEVQDNTISLSDFGRAVISYGNQKTLGGLLDKIETFPTNERVTFDQFVQFDRIIRSRITDLGLAYEYYPAVSKSHWTRTEFQKILKRVVGLPLSDGQVELLFHVFDRNSDGQLDETEFYDHVVKGRISRGLNTKSALPFTFQRVWDCIKD